MNAVIDFQTTTVNKLLELFEQLKNIEPSSQKDELIKVEVSKIQQDLREFARKELIDSVGEVMDTKDLQVKDAENVFATIFKYAMSLLIIVQVVGYATKGSKQSVKK